MLLVVDEYDWTVRFNRVVIVNALFVDMTLRGCCTQQLNVSYCVAARSAASIAIIFTVHVFRGTKQTTQN